MVRRRRLVGVLPPITIASLAAIFLVLAGSNRAAADPPVVFWASDPVAPGEAVVVIGHGFGEKPVVEVVRLADDEPGEPLKPTQSPAWPEGATGVEPIQACGQSLKFVVPEDWKQGVFAFRITTPEGSATRLLNRPSVWWAQGNLGTTASVGQFGSIRLLGKCFAPSLQIAPAQVVRLEGPETDCVTTKLGCDSYSVIIPVPNLPVGEYRLSLHNGFGGSAAWSEPTLITLEGLREWFETPETSFNVKDCGAEGDGIKDDTAAILTALKKAEENGGGTVFFPRGRYRISEGLTIPRFTLLDGEDRTRVALCWTDFDEPPEALVRGTNSFGLSNLTLYAGNHRHVIAGDLGDQPEAGNVYLCELSVCADAYRGHLTPEQVDARFRQSLRYSTGGGDTVRLGGKNIEIVNCDLYGSGRALFLSRVRGGRVADNVFYNGRWGWYCISGSDGLIFEQNEITGGDLMSTGGGLNCLDGSSFSQNVYFAGNTLQMMHGWDREAMTTDAGGEVYFGKIAAAEGKTLTLAEEPKPFPRDWRGAGVFVLAGRGAGQYRRVMGYEGATVEIDRPWDVPPDQDSDVGITMFQGHYLIVDNRFWDTGAMQFYGTSIECIVARNMGSRMQGFRGLGLWYHGYQPSWFCQFLENQIDEGNYYHWDSAADAIVEVYGASRPPLEGPLNRGAVLRGNELASNAHIRVAGTCRDVVAERNHVQDADLGIFVSRQAEGVLVRDNRFERVDHEVVDEEAIRRAAEEQLKRYLGRKEPVAAWDFDTLVGKSFADASGNGFSAKPVGGASRVEGGVRGAAVRFDGTGYLRVEEPAVFNAPDVTVALWIKPDTVQGRRGLVAKRFAGTASPFVVSQNGAAVHFEATEENGPWTFNFGSPPVLKENEWTHVAAVVKQGVGVTLYADGQSIAEIQNARPRATNMEPLILGREAWGGDPPKGDTPGFYMGLMDEVKIWTRALSPEEIQAEHAGTKGGTP